jgi:lysophospholipase L1-like esterase
MTTTFPATIDTFPTITSTTQEDDTGKEHDVVHANVHDAIVALETKMGILASTDRASMMWMLTRLFLLLGGLVDPTNADYQIMMRKVTTVTALQLGYAGDSISAGTVVTTPPSVACSAALSQGAVTVSSTNMAVSGTTSADWVPGQSTYNTAKAAYIAAGVKHVHFMLGTNDSKTAVATSKAAFRANLLAGAGDLIASGMTVSISYPPFLNTTSGVFDAGSPARILDYMDAIDSLVDNVHIFQGDVTGYEYFKDNLTALQGDGVHPTQTGSDHLATLWAASMQRIVNSVTNTNVWYPAAFSSSFTVTQVSGVYEISGGGSSFKREEVTAAGGEDKLVLGGTPVANPSTQLWLKLNGTLLVEGTDYTMAGPVASLVTAASAADVFHDEYYTNTPSPSSAQLVTSTTLNPADKEVNIALSGGNLIATRGGGAGTWGGVRANLQRNAATANHYFVVKCGGADTILGVADNTQPITPTHFAGDSATGWAYYASNGNKANNGSLTSYGVTATTNDYIGCLLKNGKLYFRKNGGAWMNSGNIVAETGFAFSGITGNVYPILSLFNVTDVDHVYFSAGDIAGVDSVPSGATAWGV